jgi:hypothetical protein
VTHDPFLPVDLFGPFGFLALAASDPLFVTFSTMIPSSPFVCIIVNRHVDVYSCCFYRVAVALAALGEQLSAYYSNSFNLY